MESSSIFRMRGVTNMAVLNKVGAVQVVTYSLSLASNFGHCGSDENSLLGYAGWQMVSLPHIRVAY